MCDCGGATCCLTTVPNRRASDAGAVVVFPGARGVIACYDPYRDPAFTIGKQRPSPCRHGSPLARRPSRTRGPAPTPSCSVSVLSGENRRSGFLDPIIVLALHVRGAGLLAIAPVRIGTHVTGAPVRWFNAREIPIARGRRGGTAGDVAPSAQHRGNPRVECLGVPGEEPAQVLYQPGHAQRTAIRCSAASRALRFICVMTLPDSAGAGARTRKRESPCSSPCATLLRSCW